MLHQLSRHVQRALALMLADVEHRQRVAVLAHFDRLLIFKLYVEECEVFTNATRREGVRYGRLESEPRRRERELCVHMVRRVRVCEGKIILRDSGLVGYSAADGMWSSSMNCSQ